NPRRARPPPERPSDRPHETAHTKGPTGPGKSYRAKTLPHPSAASGEHRAPADGSPLLEDRGPRRVFLSAERPHPACAQPHHGRDHGEEDTGHEHDRRPGTDRPFHS